MIGQGGPAISAAVSYYSGIKQELEDKPDEELEGLVKKLTPRVRVDDAIFGSGLTIAFSSMFGAAICESVGIPHEQAMSPFLYMGLPSLGTTFLYMMTYGMGKGLEYRYKRDAANIILEERRGLESPPSTQD